MASLKEKTDILWIKIALLCNKTKDIAGCLDFIQHMKKKKGFKWILADEKGKIKMTEVKIHTELVKD